MSQIIVIAPEMRRAKKAVAKLMDGGWSTDMVRYFLGGDPAPAQGNRSDDGALAILKAWPKVPEPRYLLGDWQTGFVWARRIRKWRAAEWSGEIHRVHQNFNLSGILLDAGGGGQWVQPELYLERQTVNGVEMECRPLCVPGDDRAPIGGEFIVRMFKRGGIEELWPSSTMRGDDNLWHNAHVTFQEAFEHQMAWLPEPYDDRTPEDRKTIETEWPQEKVWALKVLSQGIKQLQDIQVATDDQGEFLTSKNGAFSFSAIGKKDIAYSMMLAWVSFVHWLKVAEDEFERGGVGSGGGAAVVCW